MLPIPKLLHKPPISFPIDALTNPTDEIIKRGNKIIIIKNTKITTIIPDELESAIEFLLRK